MVKEDSRVIITSEEKVEFSPSFIICLDGHWQIVVLASHEQFQKKKKKKGIKETLNSIRKLKIILRKHSLVLCELGVSTQFSIENHKEKIAILIDFFIYTNFTHNFFCQTVPKFSFYILFTY